MELSELLKNITINVNVNVNISDESMELLRQLLGGAAGRININKTVTSDNNDNVGHSSDTVSTGNQENKNTNRQSPETHLIDVKVIADTIREYVALAESGEDITETSAILNAEILKMSDNRINVYIARFGRFHVVRPNFRNTPEIAALFSGRQWNGFCALHEIETLLAKAFTACGAEIRDNHIIVIKDNDSRDAENVTSVVGGKRSPRKSTTYTYKNSFERVAPGSGEIRIRRRKDSDELAPMIIDSEIGRELYDNLFTNVQLRSGGKVTPEGTVLNVNDSLNLVFSKEENRTRAPYKSTVYSRLRPHGYNKTTSQVTTYAINGDAFQNEILRHFNMTCASGQECIFEIRRCTAANAQSKIAYEIRKRF